MNKVVPVVLRQRENQTEILVFRHPLAGIQIVKGTVEPLETLEHATLRELYEESGIQNAQIDTYIGKHVPSEMGADWHVFLCRTDDQLAERWTHFCADDGGLRFEFFWHVLDAAPSDEWHILFQELLCFIQHQYALIK